MERTTDGPAPRVAIEVRVGELLRAQGTTLAVAESCTGGLVSSLVTDVAGSSDYLVAGLVTYAPEAKVRLLGLDATLPDTHGVASEAVAVAMAKAVRDVTGATWALSITGFAGPSGGTVNDPVGTGYVAVAGPGGVIQVRRHQVDGGRKAVKRALADAALSDLVEALTPAAGP